MVHSRSIRQRLSGCNGLRDTATSPYQYPAREPSADRRRASGPSTAVVVSGHIVMRRGWHLLPGGGLIELAAYFGEPVVELLFQPIEPFGSLNPAHPQGGSKARVFAAALGLTRADWRGLRDQLLAAVQTAPATSRGSTRWGELYEGLVDIRGHHGRTARVRTGWICRLDDPRPHLTTAYVDLP